MSHHGTTRTPEKMRDPGETKPWEPPQRPDTNGGMMDGGRGEGKKTHPPPEKPGCNHPMASTARCDKAQRRRQMLRWRQRREPAVQGTCPNNPPTQLPTEPKMTCTRFVSTTKRRRRRRWEANPVWVLLQQRTAMGTQYTARGRSGKRGGVKTPGGRAPLSPSQHLASPLRLVAPPEKPGCNHPKH